MWYHPVVGLTIAALCIALGAPEGTLQRSTRIYLLMGTIIVNTLIVPQLYRRRTGVWMHNTVGHRSRRLIVLGAIPFTALLAAACANYLLDGPWLVPVLLAVVAVVATTVFGRHYDRVMRDELRSGEPQ